MKNKAVDNVSVQEKKMMVVQGSATAPGIAIGPAYVFKPFAINLQELTREVIDCSEEKALFAEARQKVHDQLNFAHRLSEKSYGTEFSGIFESQKAFLEDQLLIDEIEALIDEQKLPALHVINNVFAAKAEHFMGLDNKFFHDRAFDIVDLKQKLILALLGREINYQLNAPSIVVAENLSPTDTVNFNRNLILGLLTDNGGATSHTAILARGLNIPAIVNGHNLSDLINTGDLLINNGFNGEIVLHPDKETLKHYKELKKREQHRSNMLLASVEKACVLKDGPSVDVMANIEFTHELNDVDYYHADGVGLFRSEALFLQRRGLPTEDEQYLVYRQLFNTLKNRPVIFRTIDLGGDKLLEGYKSDWEANPFLGWRAIRFCLDSPDVFRTQLRAVIRAAQSRELSILLPMISTVNELEKARLIIDMVFSDLQREGAEMANSVRVGVMIETPSAAVMASALAEKADFFSIGSNDLTQYVLAVDRTNTKVVHSYNPFDPAVIRLMDNTIEAATNASIDISLCGEMATIPHALPLLVGLGLRHLSATPQFVPLIKTIIRSLDSKECRKLFLQVSKLHHAFEIEAQCRAFYDENLSHINISVEEK